MQRQWLTWPIFELAGWQLQENLGDETLLEKVSFFVILLSLIAFQDFQSFEFWFTVFRILLLAEEDAYNKGDGEVSWLRKRVKFGEESALRDFDFDFASFFFPS